MTRICWWCVDIVSRMLEPDERDAVRGDFAESGETSGQALRGLLGLALRRQTALWRNWRPWLALVGAVAPLGILLSLVSRRMAQSSAITSWLYLNNWDWTYVRNTGFRLDFARDVAVVLFGFLLLSCWSWTSGFVLGYLSRRAVWINGALFCLVLATVELWGMPRFLGRSLLLSRADNFSPNAAVFAVAFYREVFPLIVHTVLVLVPSLWGMRHGLRLPALPLPLRTMLWASLTLAMTTLAIQNSAWWQVRTWNVQPPPLPHLPSLAPLALLGPVGYILATAIGRRWPVRSAAFK
jgi:hypothetical protein